MPQKPKFTLKNINSDGNTIGKRLADTRKRKGFSQTELASKIGISQRLVSDYETDRVKISAEMLCHFAFALGITADELLGIEDTQHLKPAVSLRLSRRMQEINKLSEPKKKFILKTLDDLILAAEKKEK